MKTFFILMGNKQPERMTPELSTQHANHLKHLHRQKALIICGTLTENQGELLILRADSKDIARELVKQDPFITEGYYENFIVHEFTEANEINHWLTNQT